MIDQLTYLETEFAKMDRMRDDALARGIRTLRVTYEDLVKDKGAGLERVAKFVSAGTGCDAFQSRALVLDQILVRDFQGPDAS